MLAKYRYPLRNCILFYYLLTQYSVSISDYIIDLNIYSHTNCFESHFVIG